MSTWQGWFFSLDRGALLKWWHEYMLDTVISFDRSCPSNMKWIYSRGGHFVPLTVMTVFNMTQLHGRNATFLWQRSDCISMTWLHAGEGPFLLTENGPFKWWHEFMLDMVLFLWQKWSF